MTLSDIVTEMHHGVTVVRDDLLPGGTKSRYFMEYVQSGKEYVYASPAEGMAQVALAIAAYRNNATATIFVAKRKNMHHRTQKAIDYGANVIQVAPGYLAVVQARARAYAEERKVCLVPFGGHTPEALNIIAENARKANLSPDEVWCASGSGTLARALKVAFPDATIKAVAVGKQLPPDIDADVMVYHKGFKYKADTIPPFPCDPCYDAKAWEYCINNKKGGNVLFWNVAGDY